MQYIRVLVNYYSSYHYYQMIQQLFAVDVIFVFLLIEGESLLKTIFQTPRISLIK